MSRSVTEVALLISLACFQPSVHVLEDRTSGVSHNNELWWVLWYGPRGNNAPYSIAFRGNSKNSKVVFPLSKKMPNAVTTASVAFQTNRTPAATGQPTHEHKEKACGNGTAPHRTPIIYLRQRGSPQRKQIKRLRQRCHS